MAANADFTGLRRLLRAADIRRLTRQLIEPLHELHATVVAFRSGDRFRRCRTIDAPVEFHAAAETFNSLLDATLVDRAREPRGQDIDRLALLHLLDGLTRSVLVIDAEGRITAANAVGMQALAVDAEGRLRHMARLLAKGGASEAFGPQATVTPLGHDGWLVETDPPAVTEA
jgi:nitrogen fixation/metabolism regulation signal transduction histidine kinase